MASGTSLRHHLGISTAAALITLSGGAVRAAQQTYHFTGVISHFGFTNGPIGDIQIGDTFSGSFTLDTSTPTSAGVRTDFGPPSSERYSDGQFDTSRLLPSPPLRASLVLIATPLTVNPGSTSSFNLMRRAPANGGQRFGRSQAQAAQGADSEALAAIDRTDRQR